MLTKYHFRSVIQPLTYGAGCIISAFSCIVTIPTTTISHLTYRNPKWILFTISSTQQTTVSAGCRRRRRHWSRNGRLNSHSERSTSSRPKRKTAYSTTLSLRWWQRRTDGRERRTWYDWQRTISGSCILQRALSEEWNVEKRIFDIPHWCIQNPSTTSEILNGGDGKHRTNFRI